MRIIKFLLSSAVLLVMFVVIGFFAGREILLWRAVMQLQEAIGTMRGVNDRPGQAITACETKGSPAGMDPRAVIDRVQTRFTSATEYVVEVICAGFPLDPVPLEQGKLPPFVQKGAGSGGIVWGTARSGVELAVWGRKRDVYVEEHAGASTMNGGGNLGALTPETTCQGFGYMCCQNETQSGVGSGYTQVTDCPRSCFSSCIARPVVLSFTSDPFPDTTTHTITAKSGTTVIFSYLVSSDVKGKNTVIMNFGDGQTQNLDTLSGQAQHTYMCQTMSCHFTAQLGVIDAHGTPSVVTGVSSLPLVITQ